MKNRLANLIQNRPMGLVAIVAYKAVVTAIFSVAAISLLTTAGEYNNLQVLANEFKLAGKHLLIAWVLEKFLNFSPRSLEFVGAGSALYALITGIEMVGLWQRKVWAHWLVIALVAIGLFPEIYEISHGVTFLKAIVFIVNIMMVWYLVTHRPQYHQ
jgi:uncharacterized membrane protein (DUF2068 family)